jgi:hypothetical protein
MYYTNYRSIIESFEKFMTQWTKALTEMVYSGIDEVPF